MNDEILLSNCYLFCCPNKLNEKNIVKEKLPEPSDCNCKNLLKLIKKFYFKKY